VGGIIAHDIAVAFEVVVEGEVAMKMLMVGLEAEKIKNLKI